MVLSALVLGGALFFSFRQGGPVREEVSQVLAEEAQKAGAFGSLDEALVFARSQVDQGQEHFSFKLLGQDLFLPVDQVNDRFHQAFSSRETYGFIYYKGFQWEKDKLDYRFQIDYYPGGDQERTLATIREWIQEEGILDLDQEARVKAIHDAIVFKNDYYSSQSGLDPSSTYSIYLPESLLYGQGGVCQAYASLFLMMAREAGLEADFVVGQAGGVDHAWNM
ncbi:MAG: transglutaminase-like domain-containing protein, partial [Tissierellia bacterium]|nr:transglutaminase-like domain-containing protein [Tissierellia bacterium]